jgi:hypothetical protein
MHTTAPKRLKYESPTGPGFRLGNLHRGGLLYFGAVLKFYRMDSDQPDWPVWRKVYKEVGRRDFHFYKALYHDFYSQLGANFCPDHPKKHLSVCLEWLATSLVCKPSRARDGLAVLARHFSFTLWNQGSECPVDNGVDKGYGSNSQCTIGCKNVVLETTFAMHDRVHVFYPNFLRKQGASVRKKPQDDVPEKHRKNPETKIMDITCNSHNNLQNSSSANFCGQLEIPDPENPPLPTQADKTSRPKISDVLAELNYENGGPFRTLGAGSFTTAPRRNHRER